MRARDFIFLSRERGIYGGLRLLLCGAFDALTHSKETGTDFVGCGLCGELYSSRPQVTCKRSVGGCLLSLFVLVVVVREREGYYRSCVTRLGVNGIYFSA